MTDKLHTQVIEPDSFEPERHFYPRVLNANMHSLVRFFFALGNERLAERYCHLHPEVDRDAVIEALSHRTRYFRWGGSDLFHTTNEKGVRRIVVIETNSCPSGQKSMPYFEELEEQAGYKTLLEKAFLPILERRGLPQGGLAVLWDKNPMEVTGYASVLADLTGEKVYCVPFFNNVDDSPVRFTDGVLEIRTPDGEWVRIRAALRYVTQKPWNRIPAITKTALFNPVIICLAGGRNKMLAAKAYDLHNGRIKSSGLRINIPDTIWDVSQREVPIWVERMGGVAVVKVPYSNAGQGVFTITNADELQAFMDQDFGYNRFIVQALIGNLGWSSRGRHGELYHVGTIPNKRNQIFVADLRCMVGVGNDGFFPVAIYARRSRKPLTRQLDGTATSWEMLGTNLSVKLDDNEWTTESERLMLMDRRDFNRLGIGFDELVEAYIQTVLSVTAVDEVAQQLTSQKKRFKRRLFASMNPDPGLAAEIME